MPIRLRWEAQEIGEPLLLTLGFDMEVVSVKGHFE